MIFRLVSLELLVMAVATMALAWVVLFFAR